jgi:hypothetical protein
LEAESEAEHEEVRKKEGAGETFRALKKQHGDSPLAVRRRGQPKKRTQSNAGSRKKLAAACIRMTRRAIPARSKGQGQNNVTSGALKGRTFGKRRRTKPEGITGIRKQGSRQEPRLGSRATLGRIFRKTVELEIAKQIVGASI